MTWKEWGSSLGTGWLLLITTAAVAACANTAGDYERAARFDTVQSYQDFLEEHPDSEYADSARERIRELYEAKLRREAWQRKQIEITNQARLQRIQGYVVGTLTEKQFLADDWDGADPVFGKLGPISWYRTGGDSKVVIGHLKFPRDPVNMDVNDPWNMDTTYLMAKGHRESLDLIRFTIVNNPEAEIEVPLGMGVEWEQVCFLKFAAGVLSYVKCPGVGGFAPR